MFRPVSGEKDFPFRTASQGTDTVGQQRVGDENVRDTCIGQQFETEINSEDPVESVMEGMRNIGISGVNGESRGRKTPSQFIQALGINRSEVYSSGSTCLPCPLI